MTFKCQACHEVSEHGVRPITVVMEERTRQYSTHDAEGNSHTGTEIVKELKVCEPCADLLVPPQDLEVT